MIATETFTLTLILRFQTRTIGIREHNQSVTIVEAEKKYDTLMIKEVFPQWPLAGSQVAATGLHQSSRLISAIIAETALTAMIAYRTKW